MATQDPLKDLLSSLKETSAARACLVLCPDLIRRLRVAERITSSLNPNSEQVNLDGNTVNEDQLKKAFFSAQNISLFSSETFLIIHGIDGLNAHLTKIMLNLINEMSASTLVVGLASKLPSNSSLLKFFSERNRVFSLTELQGAELERWIAKEFTQQGVKNTPQVVCSAVRQASHESPDEAYEIISKLALYCDCDTVSIEDLRALIPLESQVDEFDFISKISSAPRAQLELMVQQLLSQGVSPFPLLALIHKNFSSYYGLKELASSQVNDEVKARLLGTPPWLIKKLSPLAARYSSEQLRLALAAIARADGLLKNRSLGPEAILGELMESLTP
jgi:DNA polymerase III delta subunit